LRDIHYRDNYLVGAPGWLVKHFIYRDMQFRDKRRSHPLRRPIVTPIPHALALDDQLCFAMYSANIAINRVYRPVLERLGITYPQYLVLSALWQADGQTVGAIAERLSLESSTITPLVKRLETGGFLKRQRNPDDERQVIVTLTDKGEALHQESKCLTETLLERSGLPVGDIVRLNREISALRDTLEKGASATA
jgi:DNA-binding MarR family transcriptional regulator